MMLAYTNMQVISILLVVFLIISLLKVSRYWNVLQAHLILYLHEYQVMRFFFFSGLILNIFVFGSRMEILCTKILIKIKIPVKPVSSFESWK